MRYSITQFVMEQASIDNEIITKEKSALFSSLLDNLTLEAKSILNHTEFSFSNIQGEYDAREAINDYYYNTNCEKFFYFMKDGRVYDHEARLYIDADQNLLSLKGSDDIVLSKPFIDTSTKTELIIVYVPSIIDSQIEGIAAYYKVSNIYTLGEFFVSDTGSYYIIDEKGNAVFDKDKGININSLLTAYTFPQEDINKIQAFIMSQGTSETVISTYDNAVVSISSVQNMVDWYALSLLPSTVISAKTASVIEQSMLISAIIMGVFIVFVAIFLAADNKALRRMERMQNMDPIAECPNQYKFEIDAGELIKSNKTTQYAIILKQ